MPQKDNHILEGDKISLRPPEPSDVDLMLSWENDPEVWTVSRLHTPYSRFQVEQYVLSDQFDIFVQKQLRFLICERKENRPVGCIDLFDFDPIHSRLGVGILIGSKEDRGKGYASQALEMIINYCFKTLNLHQVYAQIGKTNNDSLRLFQSKGFEQTGVRRDWLKSGNSFSDELFYQLIHPEK
jgi:diamine N-acetyltransferase